MGDNWKSEPIPSGDHLPGHTPFGANRKATRLGGETEGGSKTREEAMASKKGSAIHTPIPLSILRRDIFQFFFMVRNNWLNDRKIFRCPCVV